MFTKTNIAHLCRTIVSAVLSGLSGISCGVALGTRIHRAPEATLVSFADVSAFLDCESPDANQSPFCEVWEEQHHKVRGTKYEVRSVDQKIPSESPLLRPAAPQEPEQTVPEDTETSKPTEEPLKPTLLPEPQPVPSPSTRLRTGNQQPRDPALVRLATEFPVFDHASFPVSKIPNWGAMRTPQEWNRRYQELTEEDFVHVPRYDMSVLTIPMSTLILDRENPEIAAKITAKLFYSTRFFGDYDLDAGEFTGVHPGMDFKLAFGTPLGSIAGGRVAAVRSSEELGTYVITEHRHPTDGTFFAVYGHLNSVGVQEGDQVHPGSLIGTVGLTGNTSSPHLHLQIDRGQANENHEPYQPQSIPSKTEAALHTTHPIEFFSRY